MRQLITNSDVRNYRQIGKQINSENFSGHVNEIQENQLTELLGSSLMYDFSNSLDNDFANYAGIFVRDSAKQITITGTDVTGWLNYSLRLNNEVFVIVSSAVLDGIDTIITVTGYNLPETLSTLDFSAENKYIKLLNGTTYEKNGNNLKYNGLRPFLSWYFLESYLVDGSLKQGDAGNFKITGELFQSPSGAQINQAKSAYLQNAMRENNRIIDYLNNEYSTFLLWDLKQDENIVSNDIIII